jgi:hypothetical protein
LVDQRAAQGDTNPVTCCQQRGFDAQGVPLCPHGYRLAFNGHDYTRHDSKWLCRPLRGATQAALSPPTPARYPGLAAWRTCVGRRTSRPRHCGLSLPRPRPPLGLSRPGRPDFARPQHSRGPLCRSLRLPINCARASKATPKAATPASNAAASSAPPGLAWPTAPRPLAWGTS